MDPQEATWEQGLTQAATILKQHKVPPPPPPKKKTNIINTDPSWQVNVLSSLKSTQNKDNTDASWTGERTFIIKKYTRQTL